MIQFYLAIFVLLACLYFKWKFSFWARKKIEGPAPFPFFGNMFDVTIGNKHFGEVYEDIYKSYPTANYVGFYKMDKPTVLIRNLDLVREILITNFQSFGDNEFTADPKMDPLIACNPFSTPLENWKSSRSIISPILSQSKVKNVYPIISDVSKDLLDYMESERGSSNSVVFEAKDLFSKYTINVVARAAFGVDGECFTNPDSAFFNMTTSVFKMSTMNIVRDFIFLVFPIVNHILQVRFIPVKVDRWLRDVIGQVIKQRAESNLKPKDFLQSILELKGKTGEIEFNENFVTGHALTFLTEGYETSSTTMTYCLYELAINQNEQRKIQKEIMNATSDSGNCITADNINKMEFLECAIYEALRMHSPVFAMNKNCTKEFELPPQFSDSKTNGIKLEPGFTTIIPVTAIHNDPAIFPNPHKFDPDRFTDENKNGRHKLAFLAFSEGPRMCLGTKFGVAQSKFGIANVLSKYNVKLSPKTDQPLRISKRSFLLLSENGIWLEFTKR